MANGHIEGQGEPESSLVVPGPMVDVDFPFRLVAFDEHGFPTVDHEAGKASIPEGKAHWIGPLRRSDLVRAVAWLGSPSARTIEAGLALSGEDAALEVLAGIEPGSVDSLLLWKSAAARAPELKAASKLGVSRLALVGCEAVSSGLQHFAPDALRHLWLSDCPRFTARTLKHLHRWTRLAWLDLRGGVSSAELIRWLAPLQRLNYLDLSPAEVRGSLGRALRPLVQLPELRTLAIRRTVVDERVVRQLGHMPALQTLDLGEGSLVAPASAWRVLRRVRHLRLRGLRSGNHTAWLRGVEGLCELESLDVRGNAIGSRDLDRLRGALPRTCLFADPVVPAKEHAASVPVVPATTPVRVHFPPDEAWEQGKAPTCWPEDAPRLTDVFLVVLDDRGNPFDTTKRSDLLSTVRRIPPAAWLDALRPSEPSERVIVALALIPEFLHVFDPDARALSRAALERLEGLFDDRRTERMPWGSAQQGTTFSIDSMAMRACLDVLRWSRQREARSGRKGGPAESRLLEKIVQAGVARDRGVVRLACSYVRDVVDEELSLALVGWLESAVSDRTSPAARRLCALDTLEHVAQILPGGAATASLDRAVEVLANALTDAGTDVRFRRAAKERLAMLAPETLAGLQKDGRIASQGIPTFESVADGLGGVDWGKAAAAAAGVSATAVLEAMQSDGLERTLAALALAPYVGSADEVLAIGEAVTGFVGRSDTMRLRTGRLTSPLGHVAAVQLLGLLHSRLTGTPAWGVEASLLLERAVRAAIRHPVGDAPTPPPGLVMLLSPRAGQRPVVASLVRRCFSDRTLGADARFALYLASTDLRLEEAYGPLIDEGEDPDLRALVGTTVSHPPMMGLEQHADLSTSPWTARRALPVSSPAEWVPLEWLLETLRVSRHGLVVRRAVAALVNRVLPPDATPPGLEAGVAALRQLPLAPLDLILDDPSPARRAGRWAAARWLAALGESRDEGRLAQAMVEDGGWYRTSDLTGLSTELDRLLAICSADSVADQAESELAPLLRLGFGRERARRIEAKAFVFLARRHLEAGRSNLAGRAAKWASELDPLNLDAVRLARKLSGNS